VSAEDDALRDMAANRGCRLVKSRRRKPGGDFGRYALKDAKSGKEVFGFGAKGLAATAEEIETFLRGDAVAGWKRSLIAPVGKHAPPMRRKRVEPAPAEPRKASKAPKRPKARSLPEPAQRAASAKRSEPAPAAAPKIREAKPGDADAIAALLDALGYDMRAADVRKRMTGLRRSGEPVLVADRGKQVVGCVSWHVTPVIHRPRPVGRITMLVVDEAARGQGIGTALVEAVEARLRKAGCGLVEVTSNMKRMRAHAFYDGLGYERTSYRFFKPLEE
jgi:ribosomal protein S18 acetylase RimI-like enzyme